MLRKAAETTLRRHGYVVSTAADGEEALRLVRAESPDLVVLDLIMPKLQGFDVLRSLKQDPSTSRIPVIVMSSLRQDEDKREALNGGATAYFDKANLSLGDLAKEIERVLRGGSS
jgi:CheY-like chemotaxis protein